MYSLGAFYVSKSVVALPFQAAFVFVYAVLLYFISGFQSSAPKFLAFYAMLLLLALTSETVGTAAGALHRNSSVGLVISGAVLLCLMLVSGFIQVRSCTWLSSSSVRGQLTELCCAGSHACLLCLAQEGAPTLPAQAVAAAAFGMPGCCAPDG